jgi:XTP/dITP diphosphohydrolase
MKTLFFVTTNNGKFQEVNSWFSDLVPDMKLEQVALDVDEIQSLDVHEVVTQKARAIWAELQKPFIVDDGGLYLNRYNNFPGTLSKYVFQGVGLEGTWLLAKDDPRAFFQCIVAYCDGPDSIQLFEGRCDGTLVPPNSVKVHPQLPYTALFVPNGFTQTMAELRGTTQERDIHHRYKALVGLVEGVALRSSVGG